MSWQAIVAGIVVAVAISAIMVALQYFIINFLELTDEEIKEYNEHVNRGANNSIYKNNPWDNWPPFIL